jgi:hypothetical protein
MERNGRYRSIHYHWQFRRQRRKHRLSYFSPVEYFKRRLVLGRAFEQPARLLEVLFF